MRYRTLTILVLLLVFVEFLSAAQPQGIQWRKYSDALNEAKSTGKPVYIFFYSNTCGWCEKMIKYVFTDPEVVSFINENFIAVKVNKDVDPQLAQKYRITGVPYHVVETPDGTIVLSLAGYRPRRQFLDAMNLALGKIEKLKAETQEKEAETSAEGKATEPEAQEIHPIVTFVISIGVMLFAGVVSAFSPCVLPTLPILFLSLAYLRDKKSLALMGASFILFYTVLGSILGFLGYTLEPIRDLLERGVGAVIVIFGLTLLIDPLNKLFVKLSSSLPSCVEKAGKGGPIVLGLVLSILWSPCIGPIAGAVLVYAMLASNPLISALFSAVYATGFALTAISLGRMLSKLQEKYTSKSRKAPKRKRKKSPIKKYVRKGRTLEKLVGLVLVVIGLLIAFRILNLESLVVM